MQTDREKRPIICTVTPQGLRPASAFDAEVLDQYKHGSTVEVKLMQRRSIPELRAYWAGLHTAVEATDVYPSAEHLHEAIKIALKLTTPVMTLDGKLVLVPDSVAIAKMDGAAFKAFFRQAERLVIERFGFNPWEREKAA